MISRILIPLVILGILAPSVSAQTFTPTGVLREMEFQATARSYRIHVPEAMKASSSPAPLVFVLHGGGSTSAVMSRAGWTQLADEEGFIVVYPEGIKRHWNDGREASKYAVQDAKTDDVGFILAILDEVATRQAVDRARVYTTGLSNGGFMSQRLAIEATERFAAAAIVIATLPTPFVDGTRPFLPKAPLSILMMNGTKDTFMPYEGGKLTPNLAPNRIDNSTFDFGQGKATSTNKAIELWLAHNHLDGVEPVVETLPNLDPQDGCRVIRSRWAAPNNPAEVELYRIEGGGHTIPGGTQYLSERIIGPLCRDIDGIQVIWNFFRDKAR